MNSKRFLGVTATLDITQVQDHFVLYYDLLHVSKSSVKSIYYIIFHITFLHMS